MAFIASWALVYNLYFVSLWLMLLAVLPAAGFLVRMFMLQHDCGHNSLFQSRLFHGSDAPHFAAGYDNHRINLTLLYGRRTR